MRHPLRRRQLIPCLAVSAAVVAVPFIASAGVLSSDQAVNPQNRRDDNTQAARDAIIGGQARNVIMLLGDGMGDSEITLARYYQLGAKGRLAMDSLPLTGEWTTYSVQKDDPTLPDYVPDSAATGTAWATGVKTYDGAISVRPNERPATTILELAKTAGLRTGDVTTAEIVDATPAVLVSHVTSRDCKGPLNMAECPTNDIANGGAGSIAEQMTALEPDILLGGGADVFDQPVQAGPYAGLTVRQEAAAKGFNIVTTKDELTKVGPLRPVLGLFAPVNMDLEWTGPTPTAEGTPPSVCTPNDARSPSQPHLVDMTKKAIHLLSTQTSSSEKGFYLQVEGASIDKADHAANPCGQIGETVQFDAAVRVALNFQKTHPDTLVIVTADHGHTSQIVEAGTTTPGVTATLVTHDGANLTVSYATTVYPGSQQHTGTEVRVAASGPQAANVLGITDQTDLFYTLKRALGVD